MVIGLICISYLIGLLWYIWCDLRLEAAKNKGTIEFDEGNENFIEYFKLEELSSHWDKMILMTYFSFTTLSTVGLGDFHPRSNEERALGSIILLGGVLSTSIFM